MRDQSEFGWDTPEVPLVQESAGIAADSALTESETGVADQAGDPATQDLDTGPEPSNGNTNEETNGSGSATATNQAATRPDNRGNEQTFSRCVPLLEQQFTHTAFALRDTKLGDFKSSDELLATTREFQHTKESLKLEKLILSAWVACFVFRAWLFDRTTEQIDGTITVRQRSHKEAKPHSDQLVLNSWKPAKHQRSAQNYSRTGCWLISRICERPLKKKEFLEIYAASREYRTKALSVSIQSIARELDIIAAERQPEELTTFGQLCSSATSKSSAQSTELLEDEQIWKLAHPTIARLKNLCRRLPEERAIAVLTFTAKFCNTVILNRKKRLN